MGLVDDHEREPADEARRSFEAPLPRPREQPGVNDVRRRDQHAGPGADLVSRRGGDPAVDPSDLRVDACELERFDPAGFLLDSERLHRVERQDARLRVPGQRVDRRGVEDRGLA